MNKQIRKETTFAGKKLILETGKLALQANMSIRATYGDTVVLVTAVSGMPNPEIDFFPLTVVYEEKLYASGSIKTSRFVKRDGRPTDAAVVTRRLVDHAIRPLFPEDYMDEVQVIITVLSLDESSDPEFLSMIATSACLLSSDIPWAGPMVSARVGYSSENYVLNPTPEELETSDLDMMISFVGEDRKFLAVEAEAHILPEEKILGAIEFARSNLQELFTFVSEFTNEANPNNEKYEYESKALDSEMVAEISEVVKPGIVETLSQSFDRTKIKDVHDELLEEVFEKFEGVYKKSDMSRAFAEVEKHALHHLILEENKRTDGRGMQEVRPIECEVGILPRTHGSGLFTRGLTQILTVATLGAPHLELLIQDMYGEKSKRFMHYYNFPPYSVGETGRIMGPKARDIGHGMLAEKALKPVIPTQKEFPYTIILMSETLSSSGSSSMASACGSTLALMDAGVPIKDMVAGIAVGLMVNEDQSKQTIITDLAYMEDTFGFLDFKMTGTRSGVTALQSDMKLKGIPMSLLPKIVEQSRQARLLVLDEMEKAISTPRDAVSAYAPKMLTIQIDPEKIGLVIGSGGRTIKDLQEKTGTDISIEEDGMVTVGAEDEAAAQKAVDTIGAMTKEVEVGEIYDGEVVDVVEYGAFVEILPGKVGLLHISEVADDYVSNISDVLHPGETVKVKVLDKGPQGKISLSKKILENGGQSSPRRRPPKQRRRADKRNKRPHKQRY